MKVPSRVGLFCELLYSSAQILLWANATSDEGSIKKSNSLYEQLINGIEIS